MSRGVPHITDVSLPDAPAAALAALESSGLAEAVAAIGEKVTAVIVSFGDGSVYRYENVPVMIAIGVKTDPEGQFQNIRHWPGGYYRVR